ncbi:MAG: hypothetical protein ABI416_06405 [Ginsengibacter sp.]
MRTLIFFLTGVLFLSKCFAQADPSDKQIMDSLLQNDEMLKLIGDFGKPVSYFRANLGAGNQLYSSDDKAVESLQNTRQLIISPSIGYYHKSGFGMSLAGFLLSENKKTDFYQYSISPFYNYSRSKIVEASLSYTHYFQKNIYSANTSPIQNELYGNIVFKKPWLKPGIATGYALGTYHEIINIDTFVRIANQRIHIKYIDTTTIKLSSFSLAGTVEHTFAFYNVFSKKDGLTFVPQFSLIAGINSYKISHKSSVANYNAFTKRLSKRIRHFQSQSAQNSKFEAQSLSLDLDLNYFTGIFYFEPEFYLDYYLPKTHDKRVTQIFNFNIGITF